MDVRVAALAEKGLSGQIHMANIAYFNYREIA